MFLLTLIGIGGIIFIDYIFREVIWMSNRDMCMSIIDNMEEWQLQSVYEMLQIMKKSLENAEYLSMLDKAEEQVRNGQVVIKTMDELIAMEE